VELHHLGLEDQPVPLPIVESFPVFSTAIACYGFGPHRRPGLDKPTVVLSTTVSL
jgi:hypothetical protein